MTQLVCSLKPTWDLIRSKRFYWDFFYCRHLFKKIKLNILKTCYKITKINNWIIFEPLNCIGILIVLLFVLLKKKKNIFNVL